MSSVVGSTLPVPIGSLQATAVATDYKLLLGVFETAPVESLIDIFYETSTSGLISEYNDASDTIDASGYNDFIWSQDESTTNSTVVSGALGFYPVRPGLTPDPIIDSVLELSSVSIAGETIGPDGNPWKDNWSLTAQTGGGTGATPIRWDLRCLNTLYHQLDDINNWITFNISVTDNSAGGSTNVIVPIVQRLINVDPLFTSGNSISFSGDRNLNDSIYTAIATNGVAVPNITNTLQSADLSYEIVSQSPDLGPGLNITLEPQTALGTAKLFQRNGDASGLFTVVSVSYTHLTLPTSDLV